MGIDPWGDLAALQVPSMPSQGVYTIDDDVVLAIDSMEDGIAPLALGGGEYQLHVYGNVQYPIILSDLAEARYALEKGNVIDLGKGYTVLDRWSGDLNNHEIGIKMEGGSSFIVESSVQVLASANSTVKLNGRLSAYPLVKYSVGTTVHNITLDSSWFTSVLVVNGEEVGDRVVGSDSITLNNYELDLSEIGDISSIGVKVIGPSGLVLSSDYHSFRAADSIQSGFYVSDSMSISADGVSSTDKETVGLLGTIIGWLTQIKDGITGVVSAIAALPGQIINLVMNALKYLFIPNETELLGIKDNYTALFEARFGFIADIFGMLDSFFRTLVDNWSSHTDYTFQFPEISFTMQGTKYTIIQSQVVSLDNDLMSVLRPVAGTFFSFVCVLGCFHSLETMFIAIVSGKNYFDYLREVPSDDN